MGVKQIGRKSRVAAARICLKDLMEDVELNYDCEALRAAYGDYKKGTLTLMEYRKTYQRPVLARFRAMNPSRVKPREKDIAEILEKGGRRKAAELLVSIIYSVRIRDMQSKSTSLSTS